MQPSVHPASTTGEILAWHYATRRPVRLRWSAGVVTEIADLGKSAVTEPSLPWIAPPLVDLQTNGYAGVDFQQDGISSEALLTAVRALRRDGCTRFFLTLITDRWPALLARLAHCARLRAESRELTAAIAGWHIEGPFLSAEPGFHGAHYATLMDDPSLEQVEALRQVASTGPILLTLAPERTGAIESIRRAVQLGITVSLGHTDASSAQLTAAIAAGATGFTHLGNGCPQFLDRHDNILWRVLDSGALTFSLIADGLHVSPAFFRLAHRLQPRDRLFYTTDAMAAAGAPPGRYTIGKVELEVAADQVVRFPGRTNFAGSALRPMDGIFRASKMLGVPWQEVWDHFSTVPARFAGIPSGLAVGGPADFCLLHFNTPELFTSLDVYISGLHMAGRGIKT